MNYFLIIDNENDPTRKKNLAKKFKDEVVDKLSNMDEDDKEYSKLKSDVEKLNVIYEEVKNKALEQIKKLR